MLVSTEAPFFQKVWQAEHLWPPFASQKLSQRFFHTQTPPIVFDLHKVTSPWACLTSKPVLIISGKRAVGTIINFNRKERDCQSFPTPLALPLIRDGRFAEMGQKGRLTCTRTLSLTQAAASVFIQRSDPQCRPCQS